MEDKNYYYNDNVGVSVLMGKTLKNIDKAHDEIIFETVDGEKYAMFHKQDCCESVTIDDICGELEDLIGTPILQAEESSSRDETPEGVPAKPKGEYDDDSVTWTFYRFATIKGSVVVRWYGTSNGYYSESVDFVKVN